jgi:hypothetical protein
MKRTCRKDVIARHDGNLRLVAANLLMDITGAQYGDRVLRQVIDDVLRPAWKTGEQVSAGRIMDAVARAMEPLAYTIDLVGSAENRQPVEKKVPNEALAHDTIA